MAFRNPTVIASNSREKRAGVAGSSEKGEKINRLDKSEEPLIRNLSLLTSHICVVDLFSASLKVVERSYFNVSVLRFFGRFPPSEGCSLSG